jgi:hypothetical protein
MVATTGRVESGENAAEGLAACIVQTHVMVCVELVESRLEVGGRDLPLGLGLKERQLGLLGHDARAGEQEHESYANFRVSLRRTADFRPPVTPCQQIFALRYENLFCPGSVYDGGSPMNSLAMPASRP